MYPYLLWINMHNSTDRIRKCTLSSVTHCPIEQVPVWKCIRNVFDCILKKYLYLSWFSYVPLIGGTDAENMYFCFKLRFAKGSVSNTSFIPDSWKSNASKSSIFNLFAFVVKKQFCTRHICLRNGLFPSPIFQSEYPSLDVTYSIFLDVL